MHRIYNFDFLFHTFSFSSTIRIRCIIDLFSTNAMVIMDKKVIAIMLQERKMYPCTCSDCGKNSEVPFEPKQNRPVYCKECLPKHQNRRF